MRDPARIDRMISRLRELWHRSPDLRLGQLIVNVIRPGEPCPRVFSAEDTDTEAKLAKYPEPVPSEPAPNIVPLRLSPAEARALLTTLRRFPSDSAEVRTLRDVYAILEQSCSEPE